MKTIIATALVTALGASSIALQAKQKTIFQPQIAKASETLVINKSTSELGRSNVLQQSTADSVITDGDKQLYFVLLKDAPLATYKGELEGYSATNINATGEKNKTKRGMLNTKSSESTNYLNLLEQKHTIFKSAITKELKRTPQIRQEFDTVLNGFSMFLTAAEAKQINSMQQTRSVEVISKHYLTTDSGPDWIQAPTVWAGTSDYAGTKGEGIIVGIMDTGINAAHPSFADIGGDGYDHTNPLGEENYLGDCIDQPQYCNDKLIGIVSFEAINQDYAPLDLPVVGLDYHGHGSHTASTTAGNIVKDVPIYNVLAEPSSKTVEISGVSPHSNIVSYQVCNVNDGCWPDLTVASLEHAIVNGVTVINYSVGGSASDPWATGDALAFLNAREAGIHVATSAGNSGPDADTIGSPGNAPWILTVAAATHDRDWSEITLDSFSGGDTNAPQTISGEGISESFSGPIVLAEGFGDALCLTPFAENTFSGQIVVCERGEIARVEKGTNVLAGGAGGLVLVNAESDGDALIADPHVLPAIHISDTDGVELTNWLSSGSGHTAAISSSEAVSNTELANQVAYFSSRGPIFTTMDGNWRNWMAPDISGPGVDIYAANTENQAFTDTTERYEAPYTFMSGTSMSSPHLAGALALIHSVRPDWSPAEVQSAIMMTANQQMTAQDLEQNAQGDYEVVMRDVDFFDMGAGMVGVADAIDSGLVMNETASNYRAADPVIGGNPGTLNTPSMIEHNCVVACSWVRTVRATKQTSWNVSFEAITPGVEISTDVASFSLNVGDSQSLEISATANAELNSEWAFANLVLTPEDASIPIARMIISIKFEGGEAPSSVEVETWNDSGSFLIEGINSIGVSNFQARVEGLSPLEVFEGTTVGDDSVADEGEVFSDIETNFHWEIVNVTPEHTAIIAKIIHADAPDMDLYIAKDLDLDGKPSQYELNWGYGCISGAEDSNEYCEVRNPEPGKYWIAVHNYQGTEADAIDSDTLGIALLSDSETNLTVTGPESTEPSEIFTVEASWDFPMQPDSYYVGLVEMGTNSQLSDNIGITSILVKRHSNPIQVSISKDFVFAGEDLSYQLVVEANQSGVERTVKFFTALPANWSAKNLDETATVEGQVISWSIIQDIDAASSEIDLSIDTSGISTISQAALVYEFEIVNSEAVGTLTAPEVIIEGIPNALIEGQSNYSVSVDENNSFTLSAVMSTAPLETDELTFSWRQTGGTTVELSAVDESLISFSLPEVDASSQINFELEVSNGRSSAKATASVTIVNIPEPSSGGGGSLLWIICLLVIPALWRREI